MTAAFGLAKDSKLSALLMITAVQSISIWNIGIKTAAAQNMVALGFMEPEFGVDISWGSWFLYAAPWSVMMSIVLYFVMTRLVKTDASKIEGIGDIKRLLDELGAITTIEKRLIIVSLFLLFFWSAEVIVHPFESTTVTIVAL